MLPILSVYTSPSDLLTEIAKSKTTAQITDIAVDTKFHTNSTMEVAMSLYIEHGGKHYSIKALMLEMKRQPSPKPSKPPPRDLPHSGIPSGKSPSDHMGSDSDDSEPSPWLRGSPWAPRQPSPKRSPKREPEAGGEPSPKRECPAPEVATSSKPPSPVD